MDTIHIPGKTDHRATMAQRPQASHADQARLRPYSFEKRAAPQKPINPESGRCGPRARAEWHNVAFRLVMDNVNNVFGGVALVHLMPG